MVIEWFAEGDMLPVYQRLNDAGRGLPDGLKYLDSWVEAGFGRCFQLMECEDLILVQKWAFHWRGLGVRFEVIPVTSGGEVAAMIAPFLQSDGAPSNGDPTNRGFSSPRLAGH